MLTINGRPLGWPALELCARVALDHPDWSADQVERRALVLLTLNTATEDQAAARLRRPTRKTGAPYA